MRYVILRAKATHILKGYELRHVIFQRIKLYWQCLKTPPHQHSEKYVISNHIIKG